MYFLVPLFVISKLIETHVITHASTGYLIPLARHAIKCIEQKVGKKGPHKWHQLSTSEFGSLDQGWIYYNCKGTKCMCANEDNWTLVQCSFPHTPMLKLELDLWVIKDLRS